VSLLLKALREEEEEQGDREEWATCIHTNSLTGAASFIAAQQCSQGIKTVGIHELHGQSMNGPAPKPSQVMKTCAHGPSIP